MHVSEIHAKRRIQHDVGLREGLVCWRMQVDLVNKVMTLSWQVTAATLASGAASGGRGATTVVFAPVQGFFAVSSVARLSIQVRRCSLFIACLERMRVSVRRLADMLLLLLLQGPSAGLGCSYDADGLVISCTATLVGNCTLTIQPAAF